MTILKKLWEGWKRFGLFIGNIVSTIVLTVFYFTVFLIFAVLFKIFSTGSHPHSSASNWTLKTKTPISVDDFRNE